MLGDILHVHGVCPTKGVLTHIWNDARKVVTHGIFLLVVWSGFYLTLMERRHDQRLLPQLPSKGYLYFTIYTVVVYGPATTSALFSVIFSIARALNPELVELIVPPLPPSPAPNPTPELNSSRTMLHFQFEKPLTEQNTALGAAPTSTRLWRKPTPSIRLKPLIPKL